MLERLLLFKNFFCGTTKVVRGVLQGWRRSTVLGKLGSLVLNMGSAGYYDSVDWIILSYESINWVEHRLYPLTFFGLLLDFWTKLYETNWGYYLFFFFFLLIKILAA